MVRRLLLVLLTIFMLSGVAMAGNNPEVKCAVHVKAHNPKQSCTTLPVITGCQDIITTYPGFNFDAFPVFFDLVEYLGLEYGMCWPAEWMYSAAFVNCATLIIGDIDWPGSGVSQTWTSCQPGPTAIPGWAWMYAWPTPGFVCICAHPQSEAILVLDCAEGLNEPDCNFCAGVYGYIGDDPCFVTGSEQSTWGGIKGIFR
jgi:hypothetical protein